jgi:hypothetical protein
MECVGQITRQYFEETFFSAYYAIGADKVPCVRVDFAKSLLVVKPFIDSKNEINT